MALLARTARQKRVRSTCPRPARPWLPDGEAARLDPEVAGTYYNRGLAHGRLGQYQEAANDFSEAIRLDPQYAEAFFNRSMSYARLGREEEAGQDSLQAIALRSQRE